MINAMRSSPVGIQAEALVRMAFCDYFSLPYSKQPGSLYNVNTSLFNLSYRVLSGSSSTINNDETGALDSAIEFLIKGNGVAVLGPGTSAQAVVTQTLAKLLGAATLSSAASSPDLSDKALYPTFMRTIPSDAFQARVFVDLCVYYGWSQVGLIFTTDSYGAAAANEVEEYARMKNNVVQIAGKVAFAKNMRNGTMLKNGFMLLKNAQVKIFIVIAVYQDSLFALSVATEMGLVGSGYAYILGDSITLSPLGGSTGVDVSGALGVQLSKVSSAMFDRVAENWLKFNVPGNIETDFDGKVSSGYYHFLPSEPSPLNYSAYGGPFPFRGEYAYDSVTMMLTAIEGLARNNVTPCNTAISSYRKALFRAIQNTAFEGVSGYVTLDKQGDRNDVSYDVFNVVNKSNEWVKVGSWSGSALKIEVEPTWSNGDKGRVNAPVSQQSAVERQFSSARVLGVLLGCSVLVFITVNLCLLYHFRSTFTIKCASPKFVVLINLGGALMCCSVFVGYPPSAPYACSLEPILGHLGYSLVFGPLLVKTWRIKKLFLEGSKNLRIDSRKYHDKRLLARVVILFLAVAVYLAVWQAQTSDSVVRVTTDNGMVYYSACSRSVAYLGALYAFEVVLLICGVALSCQTRRITDAYNESRSLGTAIYAITFIALVILPVEYGAVTDPDVKYILSSLGICVSLATVLGLILIPKFQIVLNGKDAQYKEENMHGGGAFSKSQNVSVIPIQLQEMLKSELVSVPSLLDWVHTSEHKTHYQTISKAIGDYPRPDLLARFMPPTV